MDEVTRAKYIAFGTYRQDGSIVSTPRGSSLFERVTHSQLNLALGRPRDWLATTESLLRPVTFVVAHWLEPPPIKVKVNYSRDRQLWKLSSRLRRKVSTDVDSADCISSTRKEDFAKAQGC